MGAAGRGYPRRPAAPAKLRHAEKPPSLGNSRVSSETYCTFDCSALRSCGHVRRRTVLRRQGGQAVASAAGIAAAVARSARARVCGGALRRRPACDGPGSRAAADNHGSRSGSRARGRRSRASTPGADTRSGAGPGAHSRSEPGAGGGGAPPFDASHACDAGARAKRSGARPDSDARSDFDASVTSVGPGTREASAGCRACQGASVPHGSDGHGGPRARGHPLREGESAGASLAARSPWRSDAARDSYEAPACAGPARRPGRCCSERAAVVVVRAGGGNESRRPFRLGVSCLSDSDASPDLDRDVDPAAGGRGDAFMGAPRDLPRRSPRRPSS